MDQLESSSNQDAEAELVELIRRKIEKLRPKLLDLTSRNPLLSAPTSLRTNAMIRVVDELPNDLFGKLNESVRMRFSPLPPLEVDPKDEHSRLFQDALENSRLTDETYRSILDLASDGSDESAEVLITADRALKDRIRASLGMPERQGGSNPSLAQHARNNDIEPSFDLPLPTETHEDGRHEDTEIQTLLLPDVLERRLKGLIAKHRTWEQETGIRVLHAAFGFLEWTDPNQRSKKLNLAPLVVLPVKVEREKSSKGSKFFVSGLGEPHEENKVLREKLLTQFHIDLPHYHGEPCEDFFEIINSSLPEGSKWKVRRQVAVGVFPSARLAMYHDLNTETGAFDNHEIVSALLGGVETDPTASPFADDFEVDEPEIESKVPCLVMSADSSQFSALVDLANGKNQALEGPPGTGKSQTIVNAIAAALADGKKVLFVAEKMAALDVVRSRLESVKLGEFVLPLLASRSSKEQVIEAIRHRVEMTADAPVDYSHRKNELRENIDALREYIDIMSCSFRETKRTVHDVLGSAIRTESCFRKLPNPLQKLKAEIPIDISRNWIEEVQEKCEAVEKSWMKVSESETYWQGIQIKNMDTFKAEEIKDITLESAAAARQVQKDREKFNDFSIPQDVTSSELSYLPEALDDLSLAKTPALDVLKNITFPDVMDRLEGFLVDCRELRVSVSRFTEFLSDPLEPHWKRTLDGLLELDEPLDIKDFKETSVRASLETVKSQIEFAEHVDRLFSAFRERHENSGEWPLKSLAELSRLIKADQNIVLDLRNSEFLDTFNLDIIERSWTEAEDLNETKDDLNKLFILDILPSPESISQLLTTIKTSNFLSFLSSSYRAAKRKYLSISKELAFDKSVSIERLTQLLEFSIERKRFETDSKLLALLGSRFAGLNTDFEPFKAIVELYRHLNHLRSKQFGAEIIEFVDTAALGDLALLPELTESDVNEIELSFLPNLDEVTEKISDLRDEYDNRSEAATRYGYFRNLSKDIENLTPTIARNIKMDIWRLQKLHKELDKNKYFEVLLGELFKGSETDLQPELEDYLNSAIALAAVSEEIQDSIIDALRDRQMAELKTACGTVIKAESAANELIRKLIDLTGLEQSQFANRNDWSALSTDLGNAARDNEGLFAHSDLYTALSNSDDWEIKTIVNILLSSTKDLSHLKDTATAILNRSMSREIYAEHGAKLTQFRGQRLNELRSKVAKIDAEIIQLARSELRSILKNRASPPVGIGTGLKSKWTQLSLINNEVGKKKKIIPARDLTARAGKALQELMPCWMMSPLAVAQYIHDDIEFDLVVIDEASQMTPEDALGAVRRSKQVMVVGDTNQLPPTPFFKKLLDQEDEDEDDIVLEESILDLANSNFQPKRRLKWHYRSRHSGLIAFSNEYVYDRKLVFFPSPTEEREDMGVKLVQVEGAYSSGTNPPEARAMVNFAIRFMKHHPNRSLGLVTMNKKQQELVLSDMEEAISRDKIAQKYISDWETRSDGLETFFVKNLENVQGDERDAILIGTVYGPSAPGEVIYQRFGPINGVGGKRRLNVLFTRAKELIVTFSSMTSADVRSDGSNAGVDLLKKWLDYSASGILKSGLDTQREPDSDFELHVIEQIRLIGCEAVPQVGVDGFFIDIGVKHPRWPHGFILGVECDGATYHSSKSARDRDKLRQEILENLGWHLYRIWSTDWFDDQRAETEKLRIAIEARFKELEASLVKLPTDFIDNLKNKDEIQTEESAASNDVGNNDATLLAGVNSEGDLFDFDDESIGVWDKVTIRYLDGPQKTKELILSDTHNEPVGGILAVWEPLGDALMGASLGDEIEYEFADQLRSVIVEKIEKKVH